MGFQKYEQYGKIRSLEFIADEVADLEQLPKVAMGSTCYVIENSVTYMSNSKHEWIPQRTPSIGGGGGDEGGGSTDLSNYYTKAEMDNKIEELKELTVTVDNIKTLNGESLIGQGDLTITGDVLTDEEIVSEAELDDALLEHLAVKPI